MNKLKYLFISSFFLVLILSCTSTSYSGSTGQESEAWKAINRLQGNDSSSMLSTYIRYIVNPTFTNVGNSVKLENNNSILLLQPGSIYTSTNKSTGNTTEGLHGFSADLAVVNGKVFLYETDITTMSGKEFRDSNYAGTQTVLIPIKCTEKEVTYKYEKPTELQGQEITFTITEIKK